MKTTFLDFEQPIAELESKIEELRYVQDDSALDISEEIERLQKKSKSLTKDIYAKLSPWQISQVSRHPQRPYTLDYLSALFTDFEELHGDRHFGDDPAIVGGLARFNGQSVMVIGHQKGRDTKEKIYRNFGMPRPEGYRKAQRLMKVFASYHDFYRYAWRISRHRCRGTRSIRGYRQQLVFDGGITYTHYLHRHRRRWIRRRAGGRCR
jgi:acetyl-CoA carboxylase carboxyl transferase subunit alpha